jgi:NAD(P)-dependent dehydrogenase (short-subunit alcohol dehydrogenase family)
MFAGRVAIVTGGASGIGKAVSRELSSRGVRVVVADVNESGARAAAAELGGDTASAAGVDVCDRAAVRSLVEETAAAHGRLDFIFNNAGIAVIGDALDMAAEDWDRLVDVNVRGVVHGVEAAYPLMVRQGFGHIVNTASMAGLTPVPGFTGYALTKHAVVGLSISLRAEAVRYGVRVSAVCPGLVRTSIIDHAKMLGITDRAAAIAQTPIKMYSVEGCARTIVSGVERNRAIITYTPEARLLWSLYRLSPTLAIWLAGRAAASTPLLARRSG